MTGKYVKSKLKYSRYYVDKVNLLRVKSNFGKSIFYHRILEYNEISFDKFQNIRLKKSKKEKDSS